MTTSPPSKPFDIAIIGGGIAGVTLTIGLLKASVPVTLYESAARFGEIGAGVSFGPNAHRAMELIDKRIKEGFDRRATYNLWESKRKFWFDFRFGQHHGKGADEESRVGKLIYQLECPTGQASVHRAHFLDEMVKLVPDGIAKFGKRLVEVEDLGPDEGVVLKFADGTTARHSAVIGCDGIKSRTRQLVLGEKHPAAYAIFTGKYAYRGLIPMDKAAELLGDELARNSQMYLGKHGHVLTFPIEKGKTMNVVAFNSRPEWTSNEWVVPMEREDMYADFSDWGDSVKHILSLMERPDIWALFDHPPADTYYKGRICLLGDAAHASTPHSGAGAGMAVEDAYVMSSLFETMNDARDIEAAFRAYDAVRRARTQRLVRVSREGGHLYDFERPGVEDDVEKVREQLSTRMRWIWFEDLEAEAVQAINILQEKARL